MYLKSLLYKAHVHAEWGRDYGTSKWTRDSDGFTDINSIFIPKVPFAQGILVFIFVLNAGFQAFTIRYGTE